jgi:hypothetical protein
MVAEIRIFEDIVILTTLYYIKNRPFHDDLFNVELSSADSKTGLHY